jgi:hypothetical protein
MATADQLLFPLTLAAALGCGLMAGLFFAFSVAVMKALARLPSAEGIDAMQSINVAIYQSAVSRGFLWNGGGLRSCTDRLALTMARSRYHILAHRRRALFGWHLFSDVGVQRAQEQRAGLGGAGRRCQPMD